jgi:hypothetical protein
LDGANGNEMAYLILEKNISILAKVLRWVMWPMGLLLQKGAVVFHKHMSSCFALIWIPIGTVVYFYVTVAADIIIDFQNLLKYVYFQGDR